MTSLETYSKFYTEYCKPISALSPLLSDTLVLPSSTTGVVVSSGADAGEKLLQDMLKKSSGSDTNINSNDSSSNESTVFKFQRSDVKTSPVRTHRSTLTLLMSNKGDQPQSTGSDDKKDVDAK